MIGAMAAGDGQQPTSQRLPVACEIDDDRGWVR
jgi:hypothetical protein